MAKQIVDALVVGAGPVGLFCANELSRYGISCRIIDKKSKLSDKSKALALHIRTLEVFEDTDFLNDILAQGQKIYGVCLKSNSELLAEINFEKIGSNYNFLINLPQSITETILYQGLLEKHIPLEWQSELTSIEEGDPVIASIKKPDGQIEEIATKWIIACDGAHSTLRHLCHAKFLGAAYKQQWWLADLHVKGSIPEDKLVIYISPHGPLVCLPMGNKRFRFVTTTPANKPMQPTLEDIIALFKERSTEVATLYDPVWLTGFSIHHRQIDNYRYGHVFFCGDAAHIHSPMGGQGLNTGIQDVYNLVWKLNLVLKGYATDALLHSYQLERFPVAKAILKKTDMMTKMISLKSKPLINFRNKLMSKLTSYDFLIAPITKDLAELNISYAKSPIVATKGQKTRFPIGEFIPAITLKSIRQRTSQLIEKICHGTLHNVFIILQYKDFNEKIEEKLIYLNKEYQAILSVHLVLLDALDVNSALSSVWMDENYIIQDRFNIKNSATIIIRPDKYIGYVESPFNLESLEAWLESIFNINPNELV